jgi:phage/plasmid-associated DNA primase
VGGTAYKTIQALHKIIKNGYKFDIPQECKINIEEYKEQNSSVVEFWNECIEPCEKDCTCVNSLKQVYNCFFSWAESQKLHYIPSEPEFRNEISQFLQQPWKLIIKQKKKGSFIINYKFNEYGREISANL